MKAAISGVLWIGLCVAVVAIAIVFVEKDPEPTIWLDGHGPVVAMAENYSDVGETMSTAACFEMVDDARAHAQRCYDEIDDLYSKSKLPRNCEWKGIDSVEDVSIFHCRPFTGEADLPEWMP